MITWMQTHRKYLVPTIWISTIAFVGAGFVGWGAYDYGHNKNNTAALVGDREITVNELQNAYSGVFGYYNQMFGGKLTQEQATQMHLQDIALQQLTNDALLLNYADKIGIKALDSEVMQAYTNTKAFQKDGVFNKEQYEALLRARGIDKKDFERSLEKEVILKKLHDALNLPLTPLETEASYAALSLSDHLVFKKITQPIEEITLKEAEIKKSWEADKMNYLSPVAYHLDAIKVSSADIKIDETKIGEFYNEKKHKFKDKDGKILPLKDARESVIKAMQQKGAKTAILKKYLALKKGKIKAETEMVVDANSKDFPLNALKDVKEGEFLKAVELADGYLTAKVKKIDQPKPLAYEDAKAQVVQKLKQEKAKTLLVENAKKESASFSDGKDVGFVTMQDADKLEGLNPQEASQFLRYLFSKSDKSGYFVAGDSAIVYAIKEQKLYDPEKFASEGKQLNSKH